VCLNCSHRVARELELPLLELSTAPDDYKAKLSVTLKVMYISENDQFKMYEINLKPGEYSFAEFISKIKERVQIDRHLIKVCKRLFILADLMQDSTVFA
jgi:hypothetical protein